MKFKVFFFVCRKVIRSIVARGFIPAGLQSGPNYPSVVRNNLWRGSLLPLERKALTKRSLQCLKMDSRRGSQVLDY
ncbi:hypothetical protein CGA22_09475 [Pseudomonas sp. PSB18]|nr:hypothetical protein [Pseudomonas sp. PSB18]